MPELAVLGVGALLLRLLMALNGPDARIRLRLCISHWSYIQYLIWRHELPPLPYTATAYTPPLYSRRPRSWWRGRCAGGRRRSWAYSASGWSGSASSGGCLNLGWPASSRWRWPPSSRPPSRRWTARSRTRRWSRLLLGRPVVVISPADQLLRAGLASERSGRARAADWRSAMMSKIWVGAGDVGGCRDRPSYRRGPGPLLVVGPRRANRRCVGVVAGPHDDPFFAPQPPRPQVSADRTVS